MTPTFQLFLSYSSADSAEASLLQYACETMLRSYGVTVWTYERDQDPTVNSIAQSLKERVRRSQTMLFLVSPSTLERGASQWMELGYADAFGIPILTLLHHVEYAAIRSIEVGAPPLLVEGNCLQFARWRAALSNLETTLRGTPRLGNDG